MMIDVSAYQAAFTALPNSVTEAEVNAETTDKTSLTIKGGTLADGQSGSVTKLYVRATAGQTGVAYTEKQDEAPADVIKRAVESASLSADAAPQPMHGKRIAQLGSDAPAGSVEEAIAFGKRSEALALQNPSVASVTDCRVQLCSREMRTVNSHGLDVFYQAHWVESMLNVVMKRSDAHTPGYAYVSAPSLDALDAQAFASAAAADGNHYDGGGLAPCTIPSGRYTAVLSGRVMRNILMTAWMTLSGEAMRDGKTIFSATPGIKIGSDVFNVSSVPSHPMLGQQWLFDSEGTAVQPTRLVEGGVLQTPLYTLASGKAAGMPSTGSAGRIARMTGSPPIALTTVPAILYVEPDSKPQRELTDAMGTGILLTYSLDLFHSVNVVSGAFSIPCGGVYYKDGKPVGSVSQLTMAGNLKDLFSNIRAVGNDLDFDNFYFDTYTIGSPSALVHGLSLSA